METKHYKEQINQLEEKIALLEKNQSFKAKMKRAFIMIIAFLSPAIVYSQLVTPNTFTAGEVISASKMNANFDALVADINRLDALIALKGNLIVKDSALTTFGTAMDFTGNIKVYTPTRYYFMIDQPAMTFGGGAAFTSVDCTGQAYMSNDGSVAKGPAGLIYAAKNATATTMTFNSEWVASTGCSAVTFSNTLAPALANDPAVTGVPNTYTEPFILE